MVYDQLRSATRIGDMTTRRATVVGLIRPFLSDVAARQIDDQAASALLSDLMTSNDVAIKNPAIICRQGDRAVVGLPDGLGLYMVDLTTPLDTPALELSVWTAGLDSVQVTWLPDQAGAQYTTVAADHTSTVHFALADRIDSHWEVGWFSDEDMDWWFNVTNARLIVSPDLHRLSVTGEARNSSSAFDEHAGTPQRLFSVEWQNQGDGYVLLPGPDADRTAWLWRVAVPSAYATLVEFVERVRLNDMAGSSHLVSNPSVVADAFAFGLNFPENRFEVIAATSDRITFRCVRGTFNAWFAAPPAGADRPWLISTLSPVGAAPPTP
jgi:hypothetical protein